MMANAVQWVKTVVRPEVMLVSGGCLLLLAGGMGYYSVLLGLGLLGGLWIAKFPMYGFLLVLGMIPFGQFVGDLHWLISGMVCIVAGIHYLMRKTWPEKLNATLWIWVLGFLAVNVISTLASPYPDKAQDNLVRLSFGYVFVGLTMVLVNSRGFRSWAPWIIAVGVILCAFLAVYGYYFNSQYFASNIDRFKRGTGATVSPVSLSIMIIYAMPFLAYYFVTNKGEKKLLPLAGIMIAVIGMTTTLSRGGFLILLLMGAAIGFEYLLRIPVRRFIFGVMCSVVFLWCAVLFIPSKYWERQKSLADETDGSVNRRLSYLMVGADAFDERPFLGHGTYTFKEIFGRSLFALEHAGKEELEEGRLARYAHNTYMEVLVGSGLFGLAMFLALNLCALRNYTVAKSLFLGQGRLRDAHLVGAYRLAYLGILVYLLIQSDLMHKYLLLSLGMSQVALREAKLSEGNQIDDESHAIV